MNQKLYKITSGIDQPIKVGDQLLIFLDDTNKLRIPIESVRTLYELHITNTCIIRLKSSIEEEILLEIPLNRMANAMLWYQSIHGIMVTQYPS